MSKKPKPGAGFDKLPAERRARALKALVTGAHVVPEMRTKVLDKLIADTIRPWDKAQYIRDLKAKNPKRTAKELWALPETKTIIGAMPLKTFQNIK